MNSYDLDTTDPRYMVLRPDSPDTRHCTIAAPSYPLGADLPSYVPPKPIREFATGATRDTDEGKLDFDGFFSPLVLKAFAEYMHEKRKMPDGSMRDSDNWQKGIPLDAYMKSMWRHFFDTWESHRNGEVYGDVIKTELLALLFNVQGMLHEILKARR